MRLNGALTLMRRRMMFPGSAAYWERRYANGGTSGAGSYGELAAWKADQINAFVKEFGIQRVIDMGCGDGNQLSLAQYQNYVGLDVSKTVIEKISARFPDSRTKSFMWYDPDHWVNRGAIRGDLVVSLDVILHLVEDRVLAQYLANVSSVSARFAIFFTEDQQHSPADPHVRYRNVADWLPLMKGWRLVEKRRGPHIHPSAADLFIFERMRELPLG